MPVKAGDSRETGKKGKRCPKIKAAAEDYFCRSLRRRLQQKYKWEKVFKWGSCWRMFSLYLLMERLRRALSGWRGGAIAWCSRERASLKVDVERVTWASPQIPHADTFGRLNVRMWIEWSWQAVSKTILWNKIRVCSADCCARSVYILYKKTENLFKTVLAFFKLPFKNYDKIKKTKPNNWLWNT